MIIGVGSRVSDMARIYNSDNIAIGENTRIDDFCILSGGLGIAIGSHIHIAAGTYLFGGHGIILDDFVEISSHVKIYTASDDYYGEGLVGPQIPMRYKPTIKQGMVVCGRHVLLGASVTVLPGVWIGEGCSVGAHSVVTRGLEPWGVYAGIPAKKIGHRSKKMLEYEQQFLEEYNS